MTGTGVVDLNGGGMHGTMALVAGGSGTVPDVGPVSGHLWFAASPDAVFSGHATLGSVESFAVVETELSHLDGTIHVLGDVDGWLGPRQGQMRANGRIEIDGNVESIAFVGPQGGSDVADLYGSIEVWGDTRGSIRVDGTLRSTGRILVHGTCDELVAVGRATEAGSFVGLRHLGPAGQVVLNESRGAFDAAGTLYVGPLFAVPAQTVVFDGCVRVHGDGSGQGGDLAGILAVAGCHATPDDLDICIDGAVTGQVRILQGGCPIQVGWSCVGGCP